MGISYPTIILIGILLVLTVFIMRPLQAAETPKVGGFAPDFDLLDQNGKQQRLADYRGKWLVLYFYPKDDTPGCTKQACNFRDDYFRIHGLGAVVMGVSLDNVSSHKEFAEKYHLPFSLLSDSKKVVAEAYNVLRGFGPFSFTSRQTFLIDPEGKIAKHYETVKPAEHATEIINDLKGFISLGLN